MRDPLDALPGPRPVQVALVVLLVIAALALLVVVFEYGGDLLDDGGTIG